MCLFLIAALALSVELQACCPIPWEWCLRILFSTRCLLPLWNIICWIEVEDPRSTIFIIVFGFSCLWQMVKSVIMVQMRRRVRMRSGIQRNKYNLRSHTCQNFSHASIDTSLRSNMMSSAFDASRYHSTPPHTPICQ